MKKIGLLLSGCGVYDGSEIHEAIISLLLLQKKANVDVVFIAPNIVQENVINHITKQNMLEKRNVLVESARIARGDIKDITAIEIDEIDGLVIPGGTGIISNLCTFIKDGPECKVDQNASNLICGMIEQKKPIGAICIAPVLVAKSLSNSGIKVMVTVGADKAVSAAIEKMGAVHINCAVNDIVYDQDNNVISTPAYMLARNIVEVFVGIERLIDKFFSLL